jgi:hypothetical protein
MKSDLTRTNLAGAYLGNTNLSGANLSGANLSGANLFRTNLFGNDLSGANLNGASLDGAILAEANLRDANLSCTNLAGANLSGANLSGANLSGAYLRGAILTEVNLSEANLSGANLSGANLVGATLTRCILSGCRVYGISVWDLQLEGAQQQNLIITPEGQPDITLDNLEVAQFIYLFLNNQRIRHVIDTITSKVVLILGRFSPERKAVLDALREELRRRDYLPVVFDFDIPKNRDITETVSLLARMSRFVIADLTEARSIPQELATIVPDLPSVPVQPILLATEREYSMFEHFKRYPWVLPDYLYTSIEGLLAALKIGVIDPAEKRAEALRRQP